jgi:hypothetical protein
MVTLVVVVAVVVAVVAVKICYTINLRYKYICQWPSNLFSVH